MIMGGRGLNDRPRGRCALTYWILMLGDPAMKGRMIRGMSSGEPTWTQSTRENALVDRNSRWFVTTENHEQRATLFGGGGGWDVGPENQLLRMPSHVQSYPTIHAALMCQVPPILNSFYYSHLSVFQGVSIALTLIVK